MVMILSCFFQSHEMLIFFLIIYNKIILTHLNYKQLMAMRMFSCVCSSVSVSDLSRAFEALRGPIWCPLGAALTQGDH